MTSYVRELVELLKNKKVFFDFDGTLCECRYGEYCSIVAGNHSTFLEACVFDNPYEDAKPIRIMQEVVEALDSENIYILGRTSGSLENDYKKVFLGKHFPNIKPENMIFVNSTRDKCIFMDRFSSVYGKENLVLIEDDFSTIIDAELNFGLKCLHISSFMN